MNALEYFKIIKEDLNIQSCSSVRANDWEYYKELVFIIGSVIITTTLREDRIGIIIESRVYDNSYNTLKSSMKVTIRDIIKYEDFFNEVKQYSDDKQHEEFMNSIYPVNL